MTYYNKNNEEFDLSGFQYYSSGVCANVYTDNEIAFKIYNHDCKYRLYLSRKIFTILKNIKTAGLVELIDYYHEYESHFLPMDAYSMKFVKGKDVDILHADKKYLCDCIDQLDETIKKLSENKIVMFDTHADNILFKENGPTIIDPDQFYQSKLLSKREIYERNKMHILEYFVSTIMESMKSNTESYVIINPYHRRLSLKKCLMDCVKEDTIYDSIVL